MTIVCSWLPFLEWIHFQKSSNQLIRAMGLLT